MVRGGARRRIRAEVMRAKADERNAKRRKLTLAGWNWGRIKGQWV
jgi:hypothetical protein